MPRLRLGPGGPRETQTGPRRSEDAPTDHLPPTHRVLSVDAKRHKTLEGISVSELLWTRYVTSDWVGGWAAAVSPEGVPAGPASAKFNGGLSLPQWEVNASRNS